MSPTLDARTPPVAAPPPWPAPGVMVTPAGPVTAEVDGVWWPRSRELSAELPALLADLVDRCGSVSRVTDNRDVWNPVGRRLVIAGGIVPVGGLRFRPADTVTLIGASGQRLTLLVIPPQSTPAAGHHALTTAAQPGNDGPIETLLAPHTRTDRPSSTEAAIRRWQLDGGRITERAPPPPSSTAR